MEADDTGDMMGDQNWHMALDPLLSVPDETMGLPVDDFLAQMDVDFPPQNDQTAAAPVPFANMNPSELDSNTAPDAEAEAGGLALPTHDQDGSEEQLVSTNTQEDELHQTVKTIEDDNGDGMDVDMEYLPQEDVSSSDSGGSSLGMVDISDIKPLPVEILLQPPPDPESYLILPPSETIDRILDEVEVDGQAFFSVEYTDGRIEQVRLCLAAFLITLEYLLLF